MCLYIYCCSCNKSYFVAIVLLGTVFWFVRGRTIFWSCWINISLSIRLLFWSFSILEFNYFSFVSVWCAFVKALYLFLQAFYASCLFYLILFQAYTHLWRRHLPFSMRASKLVLTFPLFFLWLIISSYVFRLNILSATASLHTHCNILLHGL